MQREQIQIFEPNILIVEISQNTISPEKQTPFTTPATQFNSLLHL